MIEEINEPIQVVVKFDKGKLCPLCFFWRSRDYLIKKVEFVHFCHQGSAKLYFFSVVSQEANYQLVFNSQTFSWRLNKIENPGT